MERRELGGDEVAILMLPILQNLQNNKDVHLELLREEGFTAIDLNGVNSLALAEKIRDLLYPQLKVTLGDSLWQIEIIENPKKSGEFLLQITRRINERV